MLENLNVGWVRLHKRKRILPLFFFFFYHSYDVKRPGLRAELLVVHEYTLLNDSPELVLLFFIVKRQESLPALPGDE